MTRIAVVRALHLGDLLCAVPALRSLRRRYPTAQVTLIGLPWARDLVPHLSRYVDAFVEFPGYPGIPERDVDQERLGRFVEAMREPRLDLAVQLHGSGSYINEFMARLNPVRLVAFHERATETSDDATYVEWPSAGTEIDRLLTLPRTLGWPDGGDALELDVRDVDRADANTALRGMRAGPYACLHPGARFATRRWGPDRFAAVGDALVERGFTVALTGTEGERPITAAVRDRMRAPVTDLTGALRLGPFAALVAGASLVVSNDTGTSHVAAAVGTKSVVIACGSDVSRWAPHDSGRHCVVWHDVPCRPCMHHDCPTAHECAAGVEVGDVLGTIDRLIARVPSYA
jgi:ADP-heptose:LPS heptosyltransferase